MSALSEQGPCEAWTPKNAREMVRVGLGEWEGRAMLDIRAFAQTPEGPVHTRKGLTLALDRAPALLEALQSVMEEARARGLLAPPAGPPPPLSNGG